MAARRAANSHSRRAHRRRRHRLQGGDHRAGARSRQERQGDHRHFLRAVGIADCGRSADRDGRRARRAANARAPNSTIPIPPTTRARGCNTPSGNSPRLLQTGARPCLTRLRRRARLWPRAPSLLEQLAPIHHLCRLRRDLPVLRRDAATNKGFLDPNNLLNIAAPDRDDLDHGGGDDLRAVGRRDRPLDRHGRGPRLARRRRWRWTRGACPSGVLAGLADGGRGGPRQRRR